MQTIIIDGKKVSEIVKADLKERVAKLAGGCGLATILAGEDPASKVYIKWKIKACQELGVYSEHYDLPASVSQDELLALVEKLNKDIKIHGILVQLPLPKGIEASRVIETIAPAKDVDCFHPVNLGRFFAAKTLEEMNRLDFLPCTPSGVMELLKYYKINPAGKKAVVLGRSNIVGKPLSMMLMAENATVSVCHSKTPDLAGYTAAADIVVAAIGKPGFLKEGHVKNGAVVIDVGTNRTESGLKGDADFDGVKNKASFITPVPGGVGPMTIAMLMKNTVRAAASGKRIL